MIEWEDIVDSIRLDEVLDELGVRVTSLIKGEHWASCPLPSHPGSDTTPSFSVNEDTLLWNCFTCNEGGLLPSLVAGALEFEADPDLEVPGARTAWQKGLYWLLPFSDGAVDTDQGFLEQLDRYTDRATAKIKRTRVIKLPLYNPAVLEKLDPAPVDLLAKWHIFDPATVEHFGIRYDPERVRIKGGKEWVSPALIIPHWFNGELVGYQERWLGDDRPKWVPKYTNSDDFPKAQTLYGWDNAVKHARQGIPVTVVESVMTVARLWEIDLIATATFGASVNPEQLKMLRSLDWLILARDEDPDFQNQKGLWVQGAGVRAFEENADLLSAHTYVEALPPISKEKGDLADMSDGEVQALYEQRKPVFSLAPPPKKGTQRK